MAGERGDEGNWFARWEEELPSPEELMPLSQTLISPQLARFFDIPIPNYDHNNNSLPNPHPSSSSLHQHHQQPHHLNHHHLPPPALQQSDFDSADLGSSGAGASNGGGGDEPARTLKRPRLVWTPQLHKRFVDAVAHLGIKNAVPKTIMQLMSVDGLTRENVASHLQKYRLYLKRMQGLASGGPGGGPVGPMSAADAATDQLFASSPIPHHFLTMGAGGGGPGHGTESFVPFVPTAALQQHHNHLLARQVAVGSAAAAATGRLQSYYHNQRQQQQMGHFGSPTATGNGSGAGFDHAFLTPATPQTGLHRMGPNGPLHTVLNPVPPPPPDDLEERQGGGSRKVLTLFPTGED